MEKVFEDYFSELQADMVSVCLEYVEKHADLIYIYSSFEDDLCTSDFFFCIDGNIVERYKLNSLSSNHYSYDTSDDRQLAALNILNDDMLKIQDVCERYNRAKPTEIKIVYDVRKNSIDARYRYEIIHSNDPDKTGTEIAEEWFDEITKQNS
jgi:hypothetical protein